jgi:hypothetical protein
MAIDLISGIMPIVQNHILVLHVSETLPQEQSYATDSLPFVLRQCVHDTATERRGYSGNVAFVQCCIRPAQRVNPTCRGVDPAASGAKSATCALES